MAAKEFHSDQGNEETILLQVDPYEEEEEEETLSLCDLPIYSSGSISARWGGEFSRDEKNSLANDGGDDYNGDDLFEFFSEEFTTSSDNSTAENIIFCGKLIPFKDIDPPRVENNNVQKGSSLLPYWRPTNKAKRSSKREILEASKGSKSYAYDYTSNGKVLVRSATKSRWFLFMFGMPKMSTTEVKLGDIRNRQSRRKGSATMFPAPEDEKEVAMKGKRSCKGMWKLLKSMSLVLGCQSSNIATDVVKAAFV